MTDTAKLDDLPALPRDDDGPVFREPWEAQAFALTLKLNEAGQFTWPEWVEQFSAEIAAAQNSGQPTHGEAYYMLWLAALEKLVAAKGVLSGDDLGRRKSAWAAAVARTPHGEPIVLRPEDG